MKPARVKGSPATRGCASGSDISLNGVKMGFSAGSSSKAGPTSTIAPFSLPLYWSRSSGFWLLIPITLARTGPFVLGDHPAAAMVSLCSVGATIFALAAPRVQPVAIGHFS